LLESRSAELPPDLLAMMRYIEKKTSLDLGRALADVGHAAETAHRWFDEADFVVLPTTPQTAFDLSSPAPANQADLTAMANMAGLPAITLALACPPGQLPAGLQIVGRRGDDARLLAWAEQVQDLLAAR
jgi:aspartyl-tRNA(Asn)/glutamyl-tRNA(Gln) amidotransferase subunit A